MTGSIGRCTHTDDIVFQMTGFPMTRRPTRRKQQWEGDSVHEYMTHKTNTIALCDRI